MLLAALLAMAVVAAVPAIAQVTQGNDQAARSGDSSQTITVTGGGDNSSACQMIQGINNTGNAFNNNSVLQYASDGKVGIRSEERRVGNGVDLGGGRMVKK